MLTTVEFDEAVTPIPERFESAFMAAARPGAIVLKVSVLKTVYVTVSEPVDKPESKNLIETVSAVVFEPPITAVCQPLTGMLNETVSVALALVDSRYVVALIELETIVTTVPDELAETPMFCKLELAFTALDKPDAMEVSVSPESTVYDTAWVPPERPAS